jgi:pyridine nucleotide-disulfide oxidoreductase family protein
VKRLVLLGGGHTHVEVLRAFAAEPVTGAQITLVAPFEQLSYSGMLPGWIAGHYQQDDCAIALKPLAAAARADLVQGVVTGIDAATRSLELADGRAMNYDVLSVDIGGVMDRDAIAGAREHGLFLRPIEHFAKLWDALLALAAERSLYIVVIGGGAAGAELAMALQYRFGERARVSLVTGGGPPLQSHPPVVQQRVQRALRRLNITEFDESCVEVNASHVVLASGVRLACEAPIMAIGNGAPKWLAASGLALDEQGFILTGPTLQSTSHAHVFAAGDVATRIDISHPKSGVYAVRAGAPLALNLRRFVAAGELQPHLPKPTSLNLVSCGKRYAIASWSGLSFEGTWVWHWKDHIDRAFVARFPSTKSSQEPAASP